ncbi:MAG: type II toxin-antitoxin system VapC family toxin [Baekduiaceae bacterium]
MTAFADSSALVTLYSGEPGRDQARHIPDLAVSDLARVEVTSAFWTKVRTGELPADDAVLLEAWFATDWHGDGRQPPRFAAIPASPAILERAVALVSRHALRALDAVQLASALAARDADPDLGTFLGFDDRLNRAAAAEGFAVVS